MFDREEHLMLDDDELLRPAQVAERYNVPVATLAWWRHQGDIGPEWFRLGPKQIRYSKAKCDEWLREQMAQTGGAA